MQNIDERIRDLEMAIAALPVGYISKKTINGKIKKYHQWTEDGKKKSKYLDDDSAAELGALIEERRILEQELSELKKALPDSLKKKLAAGYVFKTSVLIGDALKRYVDPIKKLQRRDCFAVLEDYLERGYTGKIFILYGLRRTGKTTLLKQAIKDPKW